MREESKQPLVSLIATFYNAEEYLDQCVASILVQTFDNLEVLLVDDGSTDGTAEMLDRYAVHSNKLTVLHKSNGGAADARNYGVERAHGAYVTFVDGDDFIAPFYVRRLYETLVESHAAMSVIRHRIISSSEAKKVSLRDSKAFNHLVDDEVTLSFLSEELTESPCGRLAARELYVSYPFPKGRAYEDVAIAGIHATQVPDVALSESEAYGYVMRSGSVVHRKTPSIKQALDFKWAIDRMLEPFERSDGKASPEGIAYRRLLGYMRLHSLLIHVSDDPERASAVDQEIVADSKRLFQQAKRFNRAPRKNIMRARLFVFSTSLYDQLFAVFERIAKGVTY